MDNHCRRCQQYPPLQGIKMMLQVSGRAGEWQLAMMLNSVAPECSYNDPVLTITCPLVLIWSASEGPRRRNGEVPTAQHQRAYL